MAEIRHATGFPSYSGTLRLPENVTIIRQSGCQFRTNEFDRRDLTCGESDGMTPAEIVNCRQCVNFYYKHEEQQTRVRSVFASFETF